MNNVMFFITHATLDIEHTNCVFKSISEQSQNGIVFDTLYIYNTHQHELSNNMILRSFYTHNLDRQFDNVKLFDYDVHTPKKLVADIDVIRHFCFENYLSDDRVLILKSDTCVSKNFFKELSGITQSPAAFFAPYVCAKKRVTKEEILEYCKRETFTESDDVTFFTEDENGIADSDFIKRPNMAVTDEQIKFFACRVIKVGFSSIFCDVGLLGGIHLEDTDWGGTNFHALLPYYVRAKDSFIVHMYHDVVSENRNADREGPVGSWLNS